MLLTFHLSLSFSSHQLLEFYENELLVVESFDEFCDVAGLLPLIESSGETCEDLYHAS